MKGESERHIKLGSGGIRDIEFTLQMLQMKHAHKFQEFATPSMFRAFGEAQRQKLLSDQEIGTLRETYELLRRIENRLQLYENTQAFNLPTDTKKQRWLALGLGFADQDARKAEVVFAEELSKRRQASREIFEKVFFG